MNGGKISAEISAFQALTKLLEDATACRRKFEEARIPPPATLLRFLGEEESSQMRSGSSRITVPPPESPAPVPPEAEPSWLWIRARDASPTTLVTAILRRSTSAVPASEVVRQVHVVQPEVPAGSIANIGSRLSAEAVITRDEAGWALSESTTAPVLSGSYLWGPASAMSKQDLAAHRRLALVHLLRSVPDGLQVVQIVSMLKDCGWVKAPISKDLLKVDLQVLAQTGEVKRVGNARKWRPAS